MVCGWPWLGESISFMAHAGYALDKCTHFAQDNGDTNENTNGDTSGVASLAQSALVNGGSNAEDVHSIRYVVVGRIGLNGICPE